MNNYRSTSCPLGGEPGLPQVNQRVRNNGNYQKAVGSLDDDVVHEPLFIGEKPLPLIRNEIVIYYNDLPVVFCYNNCTFFFSQLSKPSFMMVMNKLNCLEMVNGEHPRQSTRAGAEHLIYYVYYRAGDQ